MMRWPPSNIRLHQSGLCQKNFVCSGMTSTIMSTLHFKNSWQRVHWCNSCMWGWSADAAAEADKVFQSSSSPLFEKILKKSKHPHPLIYLRGFHSKDFASILDFLYLGQANVYQGDLDFFLAIAQEIELKGKPRVSCWRIKKNENNLNQQKCARNCCRHQTLTKQNEYLIMLSRSLLEQLQYQTILAPPCKHWMNEMVKSMHCNDGERPKDDPPW